MESKTNQAPAYEEFEPFCKWQRKEDRDILEIHLQDFKKDQLKVQISNHGMLKISGERPIDASRKSKFYKEYQLSSNHDAPAIHAKFVKDWLQITMPKKKTHVSENGHDDLGPIQQPKSNDQTSKPESSKSMPPSPNKTNGETKEHTKQTQGENTLAMCEMKVQKSSSSGGRRLAKVVVTLAATAAVGVALMAYVVYMYKSYSNVDEVEGCSM